MSVTLVKLSVFLIKAGNTFNPFAITSLTIPKDALTIDTDSSLNDIEPVYWIVSTNLMLFSTLDIILGVGSILSDIKFLIIEFTYSIASVVSRN
jgi:hypothetical protein